MTNKEEYKEREKWFLDRIGKTIFRNKGFCDCARCLLVYNNGLILKDASQARYSMAIEGESWSDGQIGIRYFDTKEEVLEFEKSLK